MDKLIFFMLVWQSLHWRSIGWDPKRPLGCITSQGLATPHRSVLPSPPPSCNVTTCGVHRLAVEVIAPPWRPSFQQQLGLCLQPNQRHSSHSRWWADSMLTVAIFTSFNLLTINHNFWEFIWVLGKEKDWDHKQTLRDNTSSPLPSLSFPWVYPGLQWDSPCFSGEEKSDTNG